MHHTKASARFALSILIAAILAVCGCQSKESPDESGEDEAATEEEASATPAEEEGDEAADGDEGEEADDEGEEADDDETAADDSDAPSDVAPSETAQVDTSKIIDTLAAKLPADTIAIVVVDIDGVMAQMLPPLVTPDARQNIRQDLGQLAAKRLGVNPATADWLGIAVGESEWVAILAGGEVGLDSGLKTVDIAGKTAHLLRDAGSEEVSVVALDSQLHALAPRALLEKVVTADPMLAGSERLATMKPLFADVNPAAVAAVMHVDNEMAASVLDDVPPALRAVDALALGLGNNMLTVTATGSDAALEKIAGMARTLLASARSEVDSRYAKRNEIDPGEAMLAILLHHTMEPAFQRLTPMREGKLLRIRLNTRDVLGNVGPLAVGLGGFAWFGMGATKKEEAKMEAPPAQQVVNPRAVQPKKGVAVPKKGTKPPAVKRLHEKRRKKTADDPF